MYADECVDVRVVAGLRRRAVIVTTAADEDLLGASDEQHLARAQELGRVIVSADQDFLRLAQAQLDAGVSFPGLVFILPATPVGEAIRAIAVVATVLDPKHMVNWIEWIP